MSGVGNWRKKYSNRQEEYSIIKNIAYTCRLSICICFSFRIAPVDNSTWMNVAKRMWAPPQTLRTISFRTEEYDSKFTWLQAPLWSGVVRLVERWLLVSFWLIRNRVMQETVAQRNVTQHNRNTSMWLICMSMSTLLSLFERKRMLTIHNR